MPTSQAVCGLYPELPRGLDIDRELSMQSQYPDGGGLVGEICSVDYTKEMHQAALSSGDRLLFMPQHIRAQISHLRGRAVVPG